MKTAADTSPPVISNVATPSLGQTVATITWTTNKPASSQVLYGTSSIAYLSSSPSDGTLLTNHSVSLSNLASAMMYYFSVSSTDQYGNHVTSSQYTFSTLTLPGPQISGVTVSSTSDFGAAISWNTNTAADAKVYYGVATSSLTLLAASSSLATSHVVLITGLAQSTTYYFYVQSTDVKNNATIDNNSGQYYAFTTTATQPPSISAVSAGNISIATATVNWTTNTAANSVVYFATSTSAVASSTPVVNASFVTNHGVTLNNLVGGTTYYFAIQSTDAFGNAATDTNAGGVLFFHNAPRGRAYHKYNSNIHADVVYGNLDYEHSCIFLCVLLSVDIDDGIGNGGGQ